MSATALIAEDEPLLAQALQADLGRLWPELNIAATVGDGLKALQRSLELQPAVCFLDIRMPGMSGLEVAQAQIVYQDIENKRRTTGSLHWPALLVEKVSGPHTRAPESP